MNELENRFFKIWAYTVSHCRLILRSPMKFPDQEGYSENNYYNLDIEFFSVAYLDIPTTINNLFIKELQSQEIPKKFKNFYSQNNYKIFQIKSEEGLYYIVAGGFIVGRNQWIAEDTISNFELKHDRIITTG